MAKIKAKNRHFQWGKRYYGRDAEGSPTVPGLGVAWVVVTAPCLFDQWRKQTGRTEPTGNCMFNQGVMPSKASAPCVVSLSEQINRALGTWHIVMIFFQCWQRTAVDDSTYNLRVVQTIQPCPR